ncbi:hypothetical protein ACHAXT_002648 [Thalassiosira profunda]
MEGGTPPGTPTTQIRGELPVQQLSSRSGKTEGTEASPSAAGRGREMGPAWAEAKHPKRTPQTYASAGGIDGECAPSPPSSAASPRHSPSRTASRPSYAAFAKTAGAARKRKHHPSHVLQSPDDLPAIALGGGRRTSRGARADAAAVAQGHGTHRLLVDELSYLCATLLQCRKARSAAEPDSAATGSTAVHQFPPRRGGGPGRPGAGTGRDETAIRHTPLTAGAACDVAALLSRGDARGGVYRSLATAHARAAGPGVHRFPPRAGGRESIGSRRRVPPAGPLEAVLACVACAPAAGGNGERCREWLEGTEGEAAVENLGPPSKDDAAASQALALLAYLVARDGTGSARGAVPAANGRPHRRAAALAREAALRHGGMLRGVARLVADDPVVGARLARGRAGSGGAEGEDGAGESRRASPIQSPSPSSMPSDSVARPATDSNEAAPRDPTKRGRRGRRCRSARLGPSQSSQPTGFEFSQESAHSAASAASSASGRPAPPAGDRRADQLAAAAMRARLTEAAAPDPCLPTRADAPACGACRVWMPRALPIDALDGAQRCVPAAHLALMAADCLVSGRDRGASDGEADDDLDDDDDAGAFWGSDSDDDDEASRQRPWAANPIAHANELLRRSGALPDYARAMAETLLALLLAADGPEDDDCTTCRAYLQRRASLLSEVIDGLCCLSPRASAALTHETSLLVPALLRTVAERSSVGGEKRPEASSSAVATALKTLTSLTHENRAACAQLLARRAWTLRLPATSSPRGDSNAVTGVDVIFGCLFQTASARPAGGATDAVDDDVIFCLNVLTNVVEMAPAPATAALAAVVLAGHSVGAAEATKGLAWLARWVVATTAGFRAAVLAGRFGAPAGDGAADPATSGGAVELPPGEEANLVTAGNGFVLLAYLLTDGGGGDGDGAPSDATAATAVRDAILAALPGAGGVRFAINTMKAFCNFYHFSVGDLSVAVVAPVVKLIRGLEAMAEEEEAERKPAY